MRMQRHQQQKRRPKSLQLTSSPGPPSTQATTPTSPLSLTDTSQTEVGRLSSVPGVEVGATSDHSSDASLTATSAVGKKGRTISEDMLELVQNLGAPRPVARPPTGKMTLNQMMAQKASATVSAQGIRPVYPAVGMTTAPYQTQYFSAFHTFPIPYQQLSDGSVVAVSHADDSTGAPTSSSSSIGSNIQQQQPVATSASWVQWQQQ